MEDEPINQNYLIGCDTIEHSPSTYSHGILSWEKCFSKISEKRLRLLQKNHTEFYVWVNTTKTSAMFNISQVMAKDSNINLNTLIRT